MVAAGRKAAAVQAPPSHFLHVASSSSTACCSPSAAPGRGPLRTLSEPSPSSPSSPSASGLQSRRTRQQVRRWRRREHEVEHMMISPEEYEALPPSIRYVCYFLLRCMASLDVVMWHSTRGCWSRPILCDSVHLNGSRPLHHNEYRAYGSCDAGACHSTWLTTLV